MQYVDAISNCILFASHAMKKISVTLGIVSWCFRFSPNCLLDSLLSEYLLFMHCFLLSPSKTTVPFPVRAEGPKYHGSASWGGQWHLEERS